MNKSEALRWIRRNKFHVAASTIGVILDGVTLTISIIEDGGTFGPSTAITVGEIAGGWAGGMIGGAIGSLIPVIGTTIGSFIGSIIGSLIGHGISSFFLSLFPVTQPGPGPPVLHSDPEKTAYGPPGFKSRPSGATSGPPQLHLDTKARGAPKTKWNLKQGYPKNNYKTKH